MNATNSQDYITPLNVFVEEVGAHGSHADSPQQQIAIQLRVRLEQDVPPPVLPVELGRIASLSARERTLTELLAQGRTDEAIARELGLSKRTVSYAVSALMRRVGARNRFQLGWMLGSRAADPS
ncbi:MAG TPA: helix-turn-helix transcriptional regulator [Micromonosporaceae bacterium]|nr:helix-turn-helix transcriptional regulator [Micromonosporaceae bacterium]